MISDDKGDLRIAGAGTFGMALLLVSLGMLFAATIAAYCLVRWVQYRDQPWPPVGSPHLPASLWLSTLLIIVSSITIQYAYSSIRKGHEHALRIGLAITLAVGGLFLILQAYNWWEIYSQFTPAQLQSSYVKMFYVLTGLHAAHVIGGLIPLALVTGAAYARAYSANFHPGVRYVTMYWHFLAVVWLVLFVLMYLI